tara:strand:- start:346 stop:708 length:363 start_codon:yes stop_codon:yes gene_type:complete
MRFDISHAITELYSSAKYVLKGFDYSGLEWYDERPKPTAEELQAKVNELEAAEPMHMLRQERNRRLAAIDWWTSRAVDGIALTEAQKNYRQQLRDLPATANPQLDEQGNLVNVTWPEVPE